MRFCATLKRAFVFAGLVACVLTLPALTAREFPDAEWTERPDPFASVHARKGGTIRLSGGQSPKCVNAYLDNSAGTSAIFDLAYMKLLAMNPATGALEPSLARRWSVSDDGREFVFVLDERATWSDASPVTAADVKATFDAVMDPAAATGPWKSTLAFFKSPEIVDERTIRFVKALESPQDWRDVLNCSMFWILPQRVLESRTLTSLDFTSCPVSGAYRIAKADLPREIVLAANANWWCRALPQTAGTMNFERIVYRYFADEANAFEALLSRMIDIYPVYTARLYADSTSSRPFKRNWLVKRRVRNHASVGFQGFAMNMRRPPFDDVRTRKAMAKLVDRETMNRTMMNSAYFLLSSYWPDLYDAEHPCPNESHAYDVVAAEKLLAEAGWRRTGPHGELEKDGQTFTFTFLSRSSAEDKFLALFGQALGTLGIEMKIERKDFAGWMRDVEAFNFDMTWAAWGAGRVKYPALFWQSDEADRKGSNNLPGFKSAEVDRLIARERETFDTAARDEIYREIDRLVSETVPYVLLWQTDSTRILYWNKFGMTEGVLPRACREEALVAYWWYDPDRVGELSAAMADDVFLPSAVEFIDQR